MQADRRAGRGEPRHHAQYRKPAGRREPSYEHRVQVDWPAPYLWTARQFRRGYVGVPSWMGSLINEGRDLSGLYYRRNRFYDAETGRFTQEDPIGLSGGLNAYGFANGDPIQYADPYGLKADTLEVQNHEVAFGRYHASLRVTPNDQARWSKDSRFQRGSDGKYFITFGAGPEGCRSQGLCLVSDFNRPADAAPHTGNIVLDLGGRDENGVIEQLFRLDATYGDDHQYNLFPMNSGGANSNSYISGLLVAASLPVPALKRNPGWRFPLNEFGTSP